MIMFSRAFAFTFKLSDQLVPTFEYFLKLRVQRELLFIFGFPERVRRIVDTFGEEVLVLDVFADLLLEQEEHMPNELDFEALTVD